MPTLLGGDVGGDDAASGADGGSNTAEDTTSKPYRRRRLGFDRHKAGDKNKISREKQKEEKNREKLVRNEELHQLLGDPFESLDWVQKKHFGVHFFLKFVSTKPDCTRIEAAEYSASIIGVAARTVLTWVVDFEEQKSLGRHK